MRVSADGRCSHRENRTPSGPWADAHNPAACCGKNLNCRLAVVFKKSPPARRRLKKGGKVRTTCARKKVFGNSAQTAAGKPANSRKSPVLQAQPAGCITFYHDVSQFITFIFYFFCSGPDWSLSPMRRKLALASGVTFAILSLPVLRMNDAGFSAAQPMAVKNRNFAR